MFRELKKMSSISQSVDLRVIVCQLFSATTGKLAIESHPIPDDIVAIIKVLRLHLASPLEGVALQPTEHLTPSFFRDCAKT